MKNRGKKRILALVMTLTLLAGLLPTAVFATGEPAPCAQAEGCALEASHGGECDIPQTPDLSDIEAPAPCAQTEGCALEAGHGGECDIPRTPDLSARKGVVTLTDNAHITLTVTFDSNGDGGTSDNDNQMKTAVEAALTAAGDSVAQADITTIKLVGKATAITRYNWKYLLELYSRDSGWGSLTTLDLSGMDSLVEVTHGINIFNEIGNLTTVYFPAGLKTIGDNAFYLCAALQSVTFPAGLQTIGDNAFYGCKALQSVTLPEALTTIGDNAFLYCTGLTAFDVDSQNQHYASQDGVLYDKSMKTLLQYPIAKSEPAFTVPPSVETIADFAFFNCQNLTSVDMSSCTSLTTLGEGVFNDCYALQSVTFPASLQAIGSSAFFSCNNLASMTFLGEAPPDLGSEAFLGVCATGTLYHPANAADKYASEAFGSPDLNGWTRQSLYTPSGSSSSPSPTQQAVSNIKNAKDGDTVKVALPVSGKVPGQVLEAAAGKDVTLEISAGSGVTWIVNGLDIPAGKLSDLNLKINARANTIPVTVINALTGEQQVMQLALSHNGDFPFPLTLRLDAGKENAGLFANLYYYHETAKALEYQTTAEIGPDGSAHLPFAHASSYAVIIDEVSHAPVWENPFTDVKEADWFYGSVEYVHQTGLMVGTTDTAFCPTMAVTRAQVWTVLARLDGQDTTGGDPWYAPARTWAVECGVSDGTNPDGTVTREQLVTMLYRYAQSTDMDVSVGEDTNILSYDDAFTVAEWAVPAFQWACGSGVVSGTGETTLSPQTGADRAQLAAILTRFLASP